MTEGLQVLFSDKSLKLMAHVLAGYPDLPTSRDWILGLAESGADLIEIQIPFSDPLADGPTIMAANQAALKSGVTPEKCLDLARTLKGALPVPFVFMTYANVARAMGMEHFVARSAEAGASGLIIPDLPFDERDDGFHSYARKFRVPVIPVVSAGIAPPRLKTILGRTDAFLYLTLRVGITGAVRSLERKGLAFAREVRRMTSLPLAAGFGLSSEAHLDLLRDRVDMVVIGSHLINLFNGGGLGAVRKFVANCRNRTRAGFPSRRPSPPGSERGE